MCSPLPLPPSAAHSLAAPRQNERASMSQIKRQFCTVLVGLPMAAIAYYLWADPIAGWLHESMITNLCNPIDNIQPSQARQPCVEITLLFAKLLALLCSLFIGLGAGRGVVELVKLYRR